MQLLNFSHGIVQFFFCVRKISIRPYRIHHFVVGQCDISPVSSNLIIISFLRHSNRLPLCNSDKFDREYQAQLILYARFCFYTLGRKNLIFQGWFSFAFFIFLTRKEIILDERLNINRLVIYGYW